MYPMYMLCVWCVDVSKFLFYIYYYNYTVKLVVYNLLIQILCEYKRSALHSSEKQVYRGQQIAERWKISLLDIWKKWTNEIQY
jgi:hypothetical protein